MFGKFDEEGSSMLRKLFYTYPASFRVRKNEGFVELFSSRAQALGKVGRNSSRGETLRSRSKP